MNLFMTKNKECNETYEKNKLNDTLMIINRR